MLSRKRIAGFGLLVMIVGTACGLSSLSNTPDAGSAQAPTPTPTEAPMLPVSINEGLASLDSYRMTYTNDTYDSLAQEHTVMTVVVTHDRDSDANYSRTETRVTNQDDAVVSEDVEEQFAIGNQSCSVTDGEATITAISDTARELMRLMSQVVVIHPLIENPVYVGQDTVNGVPVRTYTFEVRSVGAASEVEATRADGSYAMAVDGEYLVHYRLDMELRTGPEGDPEAESTVFFIELSLEEVNQPVELAFPPNCLAAESSGG